MSVRNSTICTCTLLHVALTHIITSACSMYLDHIDEGEGEEEDDGYDRKYAEDDSAAAGRHARLRHSLYLVLQQTLRRCCCIHVCTYANKKLMGFADRAYV